MAPQAQLDPAKLATARALVLDLLVRRLDGGTADIGELCGEREELANELKAVWDELNATPTQAPASGAPGEPTTRSAASLIASLRQPATKIERYRVGREIGRGGMGAVSEAWDAELNRTLAMKVLLARSWATFDESKLARFLEEAQITGQLDHPGIVPVHELGLDARGQPFFTMRLVRGRDLRAIFELAWKGAEGWNQTRALGVLLKVCEAMAFAHDKGVLHRDLKPANVMVGGFGEVYVMDWGVARVLGREDAHGLRANVPTVREHEFAAPFVTRDGDVVGTPAYMAPEQARGELERLSPQSDVYSVGAMLYQLLSQQAPYAEREHSLHAVLAALLSGPPTAIASLRSDCPAELIAICERAMAREPEQRYASMLAFAEDLRAYLDGRVVAAYESGAWAQARKWVLRNKALASALGAALVFLIAGLSGIAVIQAGRTRDAVRLQAAAALEAENARVEAAASERVTGFMTKVFSDQRPEDRRSHEITAREILDQAAAQIRNDLAQDPPTRVRVLDSIADAYMSLGHNRAAEEVVLDARATAAGHFGERDARVLALDSRLATLHFLWRDYARARAGFEAVLAAVIELGDPLDPRAIEARLGVVRCLRKERRHLEAERASTELVVDTRSQLGLEHPATLTSEFELVMTYHEMHRYDEAAELCTDVLARLARGTSSSSSDRERFAAELREIERASEGLAYEEADLRIAVDRLESTADANVLELCEAWHALAFNLRQQDRYEEALRLYERELEGRVAELGARHLTSLSVAIDVAEMCLMVKDLECAESTARETLAVLREVSEDFNVPIASALRVLAKVAAQRGDFELAERLARERLDALPAEHPLRWEREELLDGIRAEAASRGD